MGDGTTTKRLTPVDVGGLASGVRAIAAGYVHTCALTNVGSVKCWGWGEHGQLGDGTTTFSHATPVDVNGLTGGVLTIAAGDVYTCVAMSTGGVKCWGWNISGQLGDGTDSDTFYAGRCQWSHKWGGSNRDEWGTYLRGN